MPARRKRSKSKTKAPGRKAGRGPGSSKAAARKKAPARKARKKASKGAAEGPRSQAGGARRAASSRPKGRAAARRKTGAARGKARAAKQAARPRPFRLRSDVRPTDVDVHVAVDPQAGADFTGEVAHRLELRTRRRAIELHAADLRVSKARLVQAGRTRRGRVVAHPQRHTVEVVFDEPVDAGEATLRLAFRGRLRGDLRGLYAASSGERRYAFTQLEAADARRFFPCFDEPAFKARFRLSVTTSRSNTVLSNGRVQKVEPHGDGRKTVHFERTPLLSTYLLALAVGPLAASDPTHCGDTEIRVWHVPGKGGLAAFALETARETLARLEAYFDLPYPYGKLDLVAVPDFEAGAMENAGAVFFRETLLLVNPETATLQEKKRAAEVICHELAHMWYGDLVTMAWWDDLWLNEAFATWMAFHIVDAWKPEWRMWNDFQHYRSAALGLDALDETHPIYTKVRTPEEATENFDLITYEKGASVVRMIERYLGPETFRAGVRSYVRRHREANATAADLWDALAEASGQDVESVARAWIEQPGFPLLRLSRGTRRRSPVLRYRQERFRSLLAGRRAGGRGRKSALWPIPWVGRVVGDTGTRPLRALLGAASGELPLEGAARFVYGNADEGGFFHPLHAPDELAAIAAEPGRLHAVERMGLLGHQWAVVRSGGAPLEGFLDLALAFADEPDPDVLVTLHGPLLFCSRSTRRCLGWEVQGEFRGRVGDVYGPAFAGVGWDPGPGETDTERLRRAALLALAGSVAACEDVRAAAAERCARYLDDRRSLDPNLADTTVALAARDGDEALYERFRAAAKASATPQEQRRFLFALGAFREPFLFRRTLDLCLTDEVGTQDVAILLTRLLHNPAATEATWAFMKRRWTRLRRRMPPMLVTRPIDALSELVSPAARRDIAAFFEAHPVPTGARAVKQALEQIDLDLEFDRRCGPQLDRWLHSRSAGRRNR